jgi:hypothetical protein
MKFTLDIEKVKKLIDSGDMEDCKIAEELIGNCYDRELLQELHYSLYGTTDCVSQAVDKIRKKLEELDLIFLKEDRFEDMSR